jgi:hypothetical protein
MLPSLLTVPNSGKKGQGEGETKGEGGSQVPVQVQEAHSSTVQTALRDYALIFNSIVRYREHMGSVVQSSFSPVYLESQSS